MASIRKTLDSTGDEILSFKKKYSKKQLKTIAEAALGTAILNSHFERRNIEWCYWHNTALCKHGILINW